MERSCPSSRWRRRDFARQISEELNIGGRVQKLTWLAGSFFYDEHGDGPVEITQFGTGRPKAPLLDRRYVGLGAVRTGDIRNHRACLGDGRRSLLRRAERYAQTGGVYRLGTDVLAVPGSFYDFVESVTYRAWTPRVSAQLGISRDTFLYGSAARGFKSGGLNVTAPATRQRVPARVRLDL